MKGSSWQLRLFNDVIMYIHYIHVQRISISLQCFTMFHCFRCFRCPVRAFIHGWIETQTDPVVQTASSSTGASGCDIDAWTVGKNKFFHKNMKGPWGYWEHTLSWQPARPRFSERCRAELVCHTNILYFQPYLQRLVQCITKYTLQHSMQSAQHLLTVVEADCWLVQHRPRQPVSI